MPHHSVVPRHRRFARVMRRAPTEAEERLWHELRDRRLDRLKFRRQVPVGRFIVDFVCLDARLVVELDGSQHGASRTDAARTAELQRRGFRVLRFWNDEVLRELEAVRDTILAYARDGDLQPWR
ncbi:endonuclease domain-containing protein [Aurantimonas marina]|uniref:endonuclease domain-containing protein n=1 Tax=Aurantimonas marina TaxID=2780508 RepID=UPI0019D303B5|nr:endonuclease domain-containing protein [Aurantimonas marina]